MNLFDLFIRVGVDDQASNQVAALSQKLGNGLKKAAAIGTAAVGAAAAGYTALTKKAIENYAEYEQLVGGVETLFGAGGQTIEEYAESTGKSVARVRKEYEQLMTAQEAVLTNASQGYLTAGLSANEYMETVTSIAATLKQSLGGDVVQAAELADQALIDMADNSNKLGTEFSSVQQAYLGFSRGQFQLLDNLRIGYGGTREEMKRLIRDAAALDDSIDANSMSFANIVRAINVVQTELGITGTTSKEAATTITGSTNAMKAAWTNLTVGIADENADIDALVKAFADSVVTVGRNLVPRLATVGENVIGLVKNYGNVAVNYVRINAPGWWDKVQTYVTNDLPEDVAAGKKYAENFLNSAADWIGNEENQNEIRLFVSNLGDAITSDNEGLIKAAGNFIGKFAGFLTDPETINVLNSALLQIAENAAYGLGNIAGNIAKNVFDNIVESITSGDALNKLAENFLNNFRSGYSVIRGIAGAFGKNMAEWEDLFPSIYGNTGKTTTQSYTAPSYDYSKMTSLYDNTNTKPSLPSLTIPNININVNEAEGQNTDDLVDTIAERVAGEIQNSLERKLSVYG